MCRICAFLLILAIHSLYAIGTENHPYYNPVKTLIKPQYLCTENTETLVVVHSAQQNAERREIIRKTYATQEMRKMLSFEILFVLGKNKGGHIPEVVKNESETYNDLFIGDFVDSYYNNTIKMLFWLRSVKSMCPWTVRFLHTDDDVILDVRSIFDFYSDVENDVMKNEIHCLADSHHNSHVVRDRNEKWFVPEEAYSNITYPDYCAGAAYILSDHLINRLIRNIPRVDYLSIDDALLTGIARHNAHIQIKQALPYALLDAEPKLLTNKSLANTIVVECSEDRLKCMGKTWEIFETLRIEHRIRNRDTHQPRVRLKFIPVEHREDQFPLILLLIFIIIFICVTIKPLRTCIYRILCESAYFNQFCDWVSSKHNADSQKKARNSNFRNKELTLLEKP